MSVTSSQLLGEGAYAKVYDKVDYAVKITTIEDMEDLISVVREQHILRMHLPHTVPYRTCYYKWACMHITMEKANCNLSQWIVKKDLDFTVEEISRQILKGIDALHDYHVTHRDLKPDNILLKGNAVWLCDFGLSRHFIDSECTNATGYIVTRQYRAPEIWEEEEYTNKVDMWSIGCIIHKLIHGDVPGQTLDEIKERVNALPNDSTMDILVRGLLELDASDRWDAKRCLAFLGVEAEKPNRLDRVRQSWTRNSIREKWFYTFSRRYPTKHRILAYALMLFDSCDQSAENMCCSMAISAILFDTRPSNLLTFAMKNIKMVDICEFMTNVCDGRVSEWEDFEGTFEEYLQYVEIGPVPGSKKRKLFC